jgi:hypothetical protein
MIKPKLALYLTGLLLGGMYSTYCKPWTGDGSFENP